VAQSQYLRTGGPLRDISHDIKAGDPAVAGRVDGRTHGSKSGAMSLSLPPTFKDLEPSKSWDSLDTIMAGESKKLKYRV
jgi:hypothetical protein